jgi:hypothetical protein
MLYTDDRTSCVRRRPDLMLRSEHSALLRVRLDVLGRRTVPLRSLILQNRGMSGNGSLL